MLNKLKDALNETTENLTTEYKKTKRAKGSKLFYWLIIASILAAFFAYAVDVRSNTKAQTETIHQEFRELRDSIREQLKEQNIDIDKKIEEQNRRLEEIKAARAEKARLASLQQPNTARASQRVRPNVGGCEQYRPLVSQYSWPVEAAMLVMLKESGCRANAVSPTNDHGLFQLNGQRVYDPAENIRIAYGKYVGGRVGVNNWSAWYAVCTPNLVPKYPGIHCS